MFGFFKKRKKRDDPEVEGENSLSFDAGQPDLYCGTWEKKRQPSPGAQAYAWETLGLVPFSPISGAINVRRSLSAGVTRTPQLASMQAIPLQGIPVVAGQVFGQALYDPDGGGYNGPNPIIGSGHMNVSFRRKSNDPIGGRLM